MSIESIYQRAKKVLNWIEEDLFSGEQNDCSGSSIPSRRLLSERHHDNRRRDHHPDHLHWWTNAEGEGRRFQHCPTCSAVRRERDWFRWKRDKERERVRSKLRVEANVWNKKYWNMDACKRLKYLLATTKNKSQNFNRKHFLFNCSSAIICFVIL